MEKARTREQVIADAVEAVDQYRAGNPEMLEDCGADVITDLLDLLGAPYRERIYEDGELNEAGEARPLRGLEIKAAEDHIGYLQRQIERPFSDPDLRVHLKVWEKELARAKARNPNPTIRRKE